MKDASTSPSASEYQSQTERIANPAQVVALLRRASEGRELLTVVLPDASRPYNSAILEVDSNQGYLLLDELNPVDGHQRLAAGSQLRASCRIRGVELSFGTTVREIGGESGVAYYRVAMPNELHYQQRREHYRVEVGRGLVIPVYLFLDSDGKVEGQLCDLSAGGLRLRLETTSPVKRGQRIDRCTIPLAKGDELSAALEVRYARFEDNAKWLRIGARFLDLSRAQRNRIRRFVAQVERELIRKLPRE